MCRNIKPLFNFTPEATPTDMQAAALQYVRKISGFQKPSAQNQEAFNTAIKEITQATEKLLQHLQTAFPPKDRAQEEAKRREKFLKRQTTSSSKQ